MIMEHCGFVGKQEESWALVLPVKLSCLSISSIYVELSCDRNQKMPGKGPSLLLLTIQYAFRRLGYTVPQ